MIDEILIDMDGVLVNFSSRVAEEFGVPEESLDCWGIWDRIGLTEDEFWGWLNGRPAKWWANLCPYPWAKELYAICTTLAPVTIATSPTKSGACLDGKSQWLEKMFGKDIWNKFQMGVQKQLLATPNRVLIDDADKNIRKFTKAGGKAITFPRLWNALADKSDMSFAYVCTQLGELNARYETKDCDVACCPTYAPTQSQPFRAVARNIEIEYPQDSWMRTPKLTVECDLLNWN